MDDDSGESTEEDDVVAQEEELDTERLGSAAQQRAAQQVSLQRQLATTISRSSQPIPAQRMCERDLMERSRACFQTEVEFGKKGEVQFFKDEAEVASKVGGVALSEELCFDKPWGTPQVEVYKTRKIKFENNLSEKLLSHLTRKERK